MRQHFISRVGGILSADMAVEAVERQRHFYSRVLGTGERPLWRDDLMNSEGMPIIGLGERTAEHASLPVQWMPHLQVEDVTTSVARALALGAKELMHGRDDGGKSLWAVLLDPNGAAFGLIPVVPAEMLPSAADDAADGPASTGFIAWADLTVPEAAHTGDFYREVVGFSVEEVAMVHDGAAYADYNMVGSDGAPAAGICHARGVNADLPPVWMIYLPVADLAESLRRADADGGAVLKSIRNDDGRPIYAVIRDPAGACLALVPA